MLLNLDPATLIARVIVLLVAFTIHEFAHAWTATQFGDDTPRMYGRLTLNPLAHLDLMGSLLLVFAGFGWAKPVPVNPYALDRRSPSAMMWVSFAGPFSNFMLAILAAIPFRLGVVSLASAYTSTSISRFIPNLSYVMYEFIWINLILMLFNLLPIAPLDGEKIAQYILPSSWARKLESIAPYGPMILILVAVVGPMIGINIFGWILLPPLQNLMALLIG